MVSISFSVLVCGVVLAFADGPEQWEACVARWEGMS